MGTRDIAGQTFPTLNDVESTDAANDMTYWVGAMTDFPDLRSRPDTVDQEPHPAATTPFVELP